MAKNVSAIVSGMGVAVAIIDGLMKAAKRRGVSDEAIHTLARPESEGLFDKFVELLGTKTSELLEFLGTITHPATTQSFVAKDNLTPDRFYLGGNFTTWFLDKVEGPQGAVTLRYHRLLKWLRSLAIITELGGETQVETTLTDVFWLVEQQKNGEKGVLLTNDYANIFYVRDVNGMLRVVSVDWRGGQWDWNAYPVGNQNEWNVSLVFSCNSVPLAA